MKKKNILLVIVLFLGIGLLCLSDPFIESKPVELEPIHLQKENAEESIPDCKTIIAGEDNLYLAAPIQNLERGRYLYTVTYSTNTESVLELASIGLGGTYSKRADEKISLVSGEKREITYPILVRYGNHQIELRGYLPEEAAESEFLTIEKVYLEKIPYFDIELFGCLAAAIILLWIGRKLFLNQCTDEKQQIKRILFIAVVLLNLPLFTDFLIGGHDLSFHLSRIDGLAESFQNGLPVRVQSGWINGNGYASSIFYGDILLYFSVVLHLLGFSLMMAYKWYVFAINTLTLLIAYRCFKEIAQSDRNGMAAALLYCFFPYRLTNIYIRAAVGEYSAMLFLPVLALAFYQIYQDVYRKEQEKQSILLLILSITGLIQTHILTCEMAAIFCGIVALSMWKKTFQKERLLLLIKGLTGTVLLNLWFLLPFVDYYLTQELRINAPGYQTTNGGDGWLQRAGLSIPQLFFLRTSTDGYDQDILFGFGREMPFYIGMAGVFLLIVVLLSGKLQSKLKWSVGMLALSLWMTTNVFPYDLIASVSSRLKDFIAKIQFPWRFLTISALFLVIVFCFYSKVVEKEKGRKIRGILIGLLLFNAFWQMGDILINASVYRVYDQSIGAVAGGEYLPVNASRDLSDVSVSLSGHTEIEVKERKGNTLLLQLKNQSVQEDQMIVPLLYYRDYKAQVVGQKEELQTSCGDTGQIMVTVPESFEGQVHISFEEPFYWRIAELISAGMLVVILGCVIKKKAGAKHHDSKKKAVG